jgi:SAM-dependent methyltransferase
LKQTPYRIKGSPYRIKGSPYRIRGSPYRIKGSRKRLKMGDREPSVFDLVVEIHAGLERQGPGSPEATLKALGFLDNLGDNIRAADLGCGTGGQTMHLARRISGNITGLDFCPDFISVFNRNAGKANLQERVRGVVGSMDSLPFRQEELDLIWSEGAVDNIGFDRCLNYWKSFLKKDGRIAVSCPSWFTEERPSEIEKFWGDAGCSLDTTGRNVLLMQKAGYVPVAAFALPETCWTDNYFIPREEALKALSRKYPGNRTVEDFVQNNRYEVELYSKYKQFYGYVFYIGKKI